jgi:prevent-host-death family protein
MTGRFDLPNGSNMREIRASEAKAHLPQILDEVERGETVVITRHGRAITRLVPEAQPRQAEIDQAIAGLDELRRRAGGCPAQFMGRCNSIFSASSSSVNPVSAAM